MAGEIIEDHTSFQAECMPPTGSISFGRFETETLSWERKSSFSHNRYLEEVEKYSTPGSVTQKKAYFEAHFKKKGMLRQGNSFGQNVSEDQTNGYEDHYNDEIQFEDFQNHSNDGVQFSWYDETPVLSGELGHDVIDGEGEEVSSGSQIPVEQSALEDKKLEINAQQPDCTVAQSQIESELLSVRDISQTVEESDTTKEAEIADGPSEAEVSSTKTKPLVKTDHVALNKPPKSSTKVKRKTTLEQKSAKSIKSQSSGTRKSQKPSENKHVPSVQASTKTPKKLHRDGSLTTLPEKQMHLRISPLPNTNSAKRATKSEDSKSAKVSGRVDCKSMKISEKSVRAKKDGVISQTTSGNGENSMTTHASGPKMTPNLAKPESKISGAVFNFKSYERAEKRKEYFLKLEERLHAKEAKINEIQTKTQEETQAAMRQFRRSLTFKATPMPSFYHHEIGKKISGGKKQSSQKAVGTMFVEQSDRSSNPSNSTNTQTTTNSNQFSSTEPVLDVPIGESGKTEEMVDIIRVEPRSSKRNEVGKRDIKVKSQQQHQQKGENSHNKVKKDEKTSKVRNNASGKVMREGKGRGSKVVRVIAS